MHPHDLLTELKAQGFRVRLDDGKLFVSPQASLTDEQRTTLKANRDALVKWLESEEDDNARIDAAVQRACEENPWDGVESGSIGFRDSVLIQMNDKDEPSEYVAFDPLVISTLVEFCASARRSREERDARVAERQEKKVGKKKGAVGDVLPGSG